MGELVFLSKLWVLCWAISLMIIPSGKLIGPGWTVQPEPSRDRRETEYFYFRVADVFAMPQSGTGVSVEAVDPVFQAKMLDMLKQTGRPEMVVGWYHSHPGFGCWLSGVDINTQQSFEALSDRAVAVVIGKLSAKILIIH